MADRRQSLGRIEAEIASARDINDPAELEEMSQSPFAQRGEIAK